MTDVIITQAETSTLIITENDLHVVEALSVGPQGISAYQVAVDNGFVGTEQQWLDSLTGNQADIVVTKHLNELSTVTVNFVNRLLNSETITSVVSITQSSNPNPLTLDDIAYSSNTVQFTVTGGALLQGYEVEIVVGTSLSTEVTASIFILNI